MHQATIRVIWWIVRREHDHVRVEIGKYEKPPIKMADERLLDALPRQLLF